MARRTKKIDELTALLEQAGGDPNRLEALRRAQRFRRSWVELAEILVQVRRDGSYKSWGHEDFYSYCSRELQLRRPTVDKLTMSYSTLERHRPQVLGRDGVAKTIPSYQAVDYFARALGDDAANDGQGHRANGGGGRDNGGRPAPDQAVVRELGHAVFDEGQSVAELKRRFDPVLRPKPPAVQELDLMRKASGTARKLVEQLPDIPGLSAKRVRQVEEVVGALREDLESLMTKLREKPGKKRKLKPPPAAATRG